MKKQILFTLISTLLITGCNNSNNENGDNKGTNFQPQIVNKTLDKETYVNKTLGGLLGQFAGFLSGYEFARSNVRTGLPEDWFDFINGPYAGNFEHFTPGDAYRYDRLLTNEETGLTEVWSDDDYFIDIFNQYIMSEKGWSSYDIKETWKKYKISDWGGGSDAMMLINSKDLLAPFTGTIEAGNRYSWCTEAYIENETLGMNAPGMPNLAISLVDKFASNVGYFDTVIWAKFYAAMYSMAYFDDDAIAIMEKASEVFPTNSYPYKTYAIAKKAYETFPNDYKKASAEVDASRRNLYRIDNIQTDPNVNGGLFVLSILFGKNDYLQTTKYASIMGYDGDCTAAIAASFMGIVKGFLPTNPEYQKINDLLYHDGQGVYRNDNVTTYQAKILSNLYPNSQKIDDIVKMYQENFETLLLKNGGTINEDSYTIPTTELIKTETFLFDNYDAENRNGDNFNTKNATLLALAETDTGNAHTGFGYFNIKNIIEGEVYHKYSLVKGKTYRLVTYLRTGDDTQASLFAKDSNDNIINEESFANIPSLIAKSLTFVANSSSIKVGIKFNNKANKDDYVIFDDFMLEEINTPVLSKVIDQPLNVTNGKYIKTISKPDSVAIGDEVILSIQYRQYSGNPCYANLLRNGNNFGGFVFSNTSKDSLNGYGTVEIPYVFEKSSDAIQLSYPNQKIYIGNIEIKQVGQYIFR